MKYVFWKAACPALLLVAGCNLGPGNGWTRVDSDVQVVWNVEGRLENDGRVKTSKSYFINFDSLEVEIESVAFETVDGGAESEFDPSSPPEGYTLCHNGHCHNANDELIPYETIRLEMGGGASGATWVTQAIDATAVLETDTEQSQTSVSLGECDDERAECEIGPNDLRSVRIEVRSVALSVQVFHDDKLPSEGVAFTVQSSEPISVLTYSPIELGPDSQAKLELLMQLEMGPTIWDSIEWNEFVEENDSPETSLDAALTDALKHNVSLVLSTP